jgi:hypothetical protein
VTPAVLDRPLSLCKEPGAAGGTAGAAERLGNGRVTLEDRLNAALHGAHMNGSTECPVCQARMTPAPALASGGAEPAGAACGGCGSQLS